MSAPAGLETDKPGGPRSRKGAETRARLLAAAKEIFEESGFLDARISDIAERAGLSHGSFYHYFDSKEEVFREVAAAVEEQLSAPLDAVILDPNSDATPQQRIRAAMKLHMQSYRDQARIMGVIEQVSRYDEQVRLARRARMAHRGQQVEDSIRSMQRHGLIDPDLDPVIAQAALGAMTTRFPESWFVEGNLDCDFDEGVEQMTRVFINALGFRADAKAAARRRAAG